MITKRWSYEKEIFDYFSCCCNVIFIHCKCFLPSKVIDPVTIDYGDGYTLKVSTVDISHLQFERPLLVRQMLIMAALILERFI